MYIISQSSTSKKGGGGLQIKIEGALNGGLSIVSEYERRRLRRQSQSRLDEWGVDGFRTCAPRESAAFEKVQMGCWCGFNGAGTVVIISTEQ